MKGEVMDVSKIRTEKDLRAWLDLQQQQLEETSQFLAELKAQRQVSKLERVEDRIELLASQGMDYGAAFELAVSELEEDEYKAQTRAAQAQRERVETELEELTPQEEQLLLEALEDGEDGN